jgi:hypothetical protein
MKTLPQFITENNITIKAVKAKNNPHMDNSHDMDHWSVTLYMGEHIMGLGLATHIIPFSMGSAYKGKRPEVADVLSCLASDASGADQDFESWASDLGYDTDSRKAESIYNTCVEQTEILKRFLGDDLFQELVYEVEPY